jgi:anti-sigma factor RsiW
MKCIEYKNWLLNRDSVDSSSDLVVKAHIEDCMSCKKLHHVDKELEGIIKKEFLAEEVPPGVAQRIDAGLRKKEDNSVFFEIHFRKLIPAVAVPLVVLFFILSYLPSDFKNLQQISDLVVQHHLKSDYEMTFTENEIKQGVAMLNRELGFKVIIPDLSREGYQLLGGRQCKLERRDVAYILYENQERIHSLFVLNSKYLGFDMAEGGSYKDVNKGCTINIWKANSQIYALVN